jgi:hypothetical protein
MIQSRIFLQLCQRCCDIEVGQKYGILQNGMEGHQNDLKIWNLKIISFQRKVFFQSFKEIWCKFSSFCKRFEVKRHFFAQKVHIFSLNPTRHQF